MLGRREEGASHLRIQQTSFPLNHTHGLTKRLQRMRLALTIRHHSRQLQLQFLRMQLRSKRIANMLSLARWDLHIIPRGSQVANILHAVGGEGICPEGAADEDDGDGGGLGVVDVQEGGGGEAVDELYAEDLGAGERGLDLDVQGRGFGWRFNFFVGLGLCERKSEREARWVFTYILR